MVKFVNKLFQFAVLLLLFAILSSCTSTRSLTIQIPESGNKELPQEIQSLTIVTQAVNSRYNDVSADSLQQLFYKRNFDLDTVIYDRQVVDTTLKVLGQLLFESGRYDYVIPEDRFIRRPGGSSFSVEMPWDQVEALCNTYDTDAVLSLDHFSTRVITDISRDQYMYDFTYYTSIQAEMQVQYEALFRVYYPEERKIMVRELVQDTLLWQDSDNSVNSLFSHFTPVKHALEEAGIHAALTFTDTIAVIWHTGRRVLFDGGREFEVPASLAADGNWQQAVETWHKIIESGGSKSEKSKAMFNLAVGYEMLGDLDQAVKWAVESYRTTYRAVTYEYLEILKERRKNQKNQT